MVPYQKRPCRSHLPSLERFLGLSFAGAAKRVTAPLPVSKKSMPVRLATIRPPFRRTPMDVTISGVGQVLCAPLCGCQRCSFLAGTSVQYSACSRACQVGPSPSPHLLSNPHSILATYSSSIRQSRSSDPAHLPRPIHRPPQSRDPRAESCVHRGHPDRAPP